MFLLMIKFKAKLREISFLLVLISIPKIANFLL